MEPLTHFLTGACIGRAGLNRRTAYATLAATLAAEAPDLDILWSLRGPVVGFAHHRGITHTLIAAPAVALIITGFVWCIDIVAAAALTRFRRPRSDSGQSHIPPQPIRWLWVYFSAFLADLSHLLLDLTNNYGLRPFFPFSGRWYSGDLVFIAEPVLWALLAGALVMPPLLGLAQRKADRKIAPHAGRLHSRGWAIFALGGMVMLWCWRWAEHAQALKIVAAAEVTPTPALRISLEPYPLNPFRWHALLETETTWQVAEVNTQTGSVDSDPRISSLLKQPLTPAIEAARRTYLGQVYLDWSQWPVVRALGSQPGTQTSYETRVEFNDLRFAYSVLGADSLAANQDIHRSLDSVGPSGYVSVLNGNQPDGEFMHGIRQK